MVKKIILFGTGALFCLMFIAYSCNNNQNPTTKSTGTTGTTLISTPNPTSSAFVTDPSLPPPDMDTDLLAWDGTTTEEPTLLDDVYEVNNANELAWIAAQTSDFAGKTIKLMESINLNDKEFNGIASFAGTFEGNKKTIHNINISKNSVNNIGLIGSLETDGVIQNLTISEGSVSGKSYVGGIVGKNNGDNTMISNVANYGVAVTGGYNNIGGIIGYSYGDLTIVSVANSANVTGKSYIGGIIGYSRNTTSNITKVRNAGSISANGSYVGGILGASAGATIKDAGNSGDVSGNRVVGGIIGLSLINPSPIDDSYNYGDIIESSPYDEIGAIVGAIYSASANLDMNDCYYLTASYGALGVNLNNVATVTDNSTEITLEEFKIESTFTGLDFVNTWSMGTLHPILK